MERTLLAMRHAKSSWKDASLADFDRPLNARGRRDAKRAGEWLSEQGLIPDVILSSAARRARLTAERVGKGLKRPVEVVLTRDLYHAPPEVYNEWVRAVPEEVQTLLVIGHNPGIAQWIARLTGEVVDVPTAAIACIKLWDTPWSSLAADGSGTLQSYWYPKLERDQD